MTDDRHEEGPDLEASLAFINTLEHSASGDRDDLPTLSAALGWLVEQGAMPPETAAALGSEADAQRRLAEVVELRAALREIVDSAVAARSPRLDAVATVNRALAAAPVPELIAAPAGVVRGYRHRAEPLAEALSVIAMPLAETLAEGRPDRLRVCSNDSCRWVFYDTSRTGRRRWCDMSTCGNRAKAARHRARRRGAPSAG